MSSTPPHEGAAAAVSNTASKDEEPRRFKFPSHKSHMVNLAKMCQENKEYADCVIQCDGVNLKAHRLVLGSASRFLKLVFQEVRQGEGNIQNQIYLNGGMNFGFYRVVQGLWLSSFGKLLLSKCLTKSFDSLETGTKAC